MNTSLIQVARPPRTEGVVGKLLPKPAGCEWDENPSAGRGLRAVRLLLGCNSAPFRNHSGAVAPTHLALRLLSADESATRLMSGSARSCLQCDNCTLTAWLS